MAVAICSTTEHPTTPEEKDCPKSHGVDSCWHVAILAGSVAFLSSAPQSASGFFYVGFMEEFGVNRESASWPSNGIAALAHLSGIFLAVLQHRITLFQIFFVGGVLLWTGILASAFVSNMTYMTITFGIIHGLGYGLSMMTLSVLLNMYFDRYRALTSGIYYSGMSCSGLAFPKFLAYLQDKYGFRGTLLIYGGIITHVTAFGLLLKEPPWMCLKQCVTKERHPILEGTRGIQSQLANLDQNKGSKANGNHEHSRNLPSLLLLLRKPMFYVIVSCAAIGDMIFSVFVSTMVDYGLDKGLSLSDAEFLIIYGSCAQIAGRLLVPLLADAKLIQRSNLVMINIIIGGGSMILMSNMILHAHVLFVCLCVYISLGFLTSMKSVLIADYLGIEWISAIYGVAGVVLLPLTFTTPTIIGFFRDFGGSYDDLYRMYGAILLLLFGFFLFVTCVERKRNHVWAPGQNAQEGSQRSLTEQTRNT